MLISIDFLRFSLKSEGSKGPLSGLDLLTHVIAVCKDAGTWIITGADLGATLACAAIAKVFRL